MILSESYKILKLLIFFLRLSVPTACADLIETEHFLEEFLPKTNKRPGVDQNCEKPIFKFH